MKTETVSYAIEHGLRKGDFIWWIVAKDGYQPSRVINVVDSHTVTIRPWRWTDWIGYAVYKLKWWWLNRWWAMLDRIEYWRSLL